MLLPVKKLTRYIATKDGYMSSMDKDRNLIGTKLVKAGDVSLSPSVAADTKVEAEAEQAKSKAEIDKTKAEIGVIKETK